ncbi:hypothetical protein BDW68DRAFT_187430 [Aspergillus falconensis]
MTPECPGWNLANMDAKRGVGLKMVWFLPFRDVCYFGELSRTQEAIGPGCLSVEDLDEGLKLATLMSHAAIVAALFSAGARVLTRATGSLPEKNLQQDPSIVRHFLDHGLDPNSRLSSGEPLLPMLLSPASARELLSVGADPTLCGPRGVTPLARVTVSTREPDPSLLELYLAYGANLDSYLLLCAVAQRIHQGELRTRFLIDKGVDPNVASDEWRTSLRRAVSGSKLDLVKLLLDVGADPTALSCGRKTRGKSPAQVAESVPHLETRVAILDLLQLYSRQDPGYTIREFERL